MRYTRNQLLTIDEAVQKYGIPKAKLIGHCVREADEDPLAIDRDENGEYLIADDWRLHRLVKQQQ